MAKVTWDREINGNKGRIPIERINAAFSMTVKDRDRLRELAILNETSQSALIGRWIKEHYKQEIEEKQQN